VMRFLIQDREDIRRALRVFAVIAVVNAISMINEQATGVNVFGALSGGDARSAVRDGKIRSQGAFGQFLTAGSFGAALVPLYIWLWSDGKFKKTAVIGLIATGAMTITSGASTTVIGCMAGVGGLFLWPMRNNLRLIRWGIVGTLVGLHMVMNGPVWSILEHIDLTGSSSSYHRYMLIDNLVRHFTDWFLLGSKDYATWGWMMWDTCNQYVAYAFAGGLLPLSLFIAVIVKAFSRIGLSRRHVQGNDREEWLFWCLGNAMLCHVVCFLGVAYWDQVQFAWAAFLAIISVAVAEVNAVAVDVPEPGLATGLELHPASS
jgi:hypothetical protein